MLCIPFASLHYKPNTNTLVHSRIRAQEIYKFIAMAKQPNRGKRDRSIQFWCDSSEFDFIKKESEKAGISRGNFCRQVVLGHLPQSSHISNGSITRQDVKELHKELRAIGTNLNQLAKHANTTQAVPHLEKIESGIEEFTRLNQEILEVLR